MERQEQQSVGKYLLPPGAPDGDYRDYTSSPLKTYITQRMPPAPPGDEHWPEEIGFTTETTATVYRNVYGSTSTTDYANLGSGSGRWTNPPRAVTTDGYVVDSTINHRKSDFTRYTSVPLTGFPAGIYDFIGPTDVFTTTTSDSAIVNTGAGNIHLAPSITTTSDSATVNTGTGNLHVQPWTPPSGVKVLDKDLLYKALSTKKQEDSSSD
jgi:hypothetical protein